ncbi:hypothetical protein CYMTET_29018 [Cymbomonas tetramitiformis]|uniref:RING-type domain-containing protein n=1 Tax=Cymbomonas tetramitiformis TaxID=36881 RepID=A0AAE0FLT6_9CHLO|nr:hypothetical protein CYMTET_29018 [Cymbomonas tetramitiformis]
MVQLARRGAWNLMCSAALGGFAMVLLRRQVLRLRYIARWGHAPHETVLENPATSSVEGEMDMDDTDEEEAEASDTMENTGRDRAESTSWGACVVCLQRRRRVVFTPCGHRACCQRCARQVAQARGRQERRCPVCRQEVSRDVVRVFDP